MFASSMHSTLQSLSSTTTSQYIHVLGNAYCNDWKQSSYNPRFVASTMLQQIQPGSIAIFHVAEKEF
jgi:hypothetical protein